MTDKAAEKAKRATKEGERTRDPVPKSAGKAPPEEPLDEESLERVMRDSPL